MKISKEQLYIIIGYVLFLLVFYFIGVTKQQFDAFVAIGLLTGIYAYGVHIAKKILAK